MCRINIALLVLSFVKDPREDKCQIFLMYVLSSSDNLIPFQRGGEEASWSGGKHSARSSNIILSVSKTLSDN
jgi:hypothetical protein